MIFLDSKLNAMHRTFWRAYPRYSMMLTSILKMLPSFDKAIAPWCVITPSQFRFRRNVASSTAQQGSTPHSTYDLCLANTPLCGWIVSNQQRTLCRAFTLTHIYLRGILSFMRR